MKVKGKQAWKPMYSLHSSWGNDHVYIADMKAEIACLCAKTIPRCHFLQWHFEETYNFLATVRDQRDKSAAQLPALVAAEATIRVGDHKRTRFITSTGNITSANYPWAHMLPKQPLIRVVSTQRAGAASRASAKGEDWPGGRQRSVIWQTDASIAYFKLPRR